MSGKDKFSFGSQPSMREVPLTEAATLKFTGAPKLIDTEWGQKYSFPITLLSHPSYDTLPINCNWESKCQVAKELWNAYNDEPNDAQKMFMGVYENSKWKLTRFDNGAYWIDSL